MDWIDAIRLVAITTWKAPANRMNRNSGFGLKTEREFGSHCTLTAKNRSGPLVSDQQAPQLAVSQMRLAAGAFGSRRSLGVPWPRRTYTVPFSAESRRRLGACFRRRNFGAAVGSAWLTLAPTKQTLGLQWERTCEARPSKLGLLKDKEETDKYLSGTTV